MYLNIPLKQFSHGVSHLYATFATTIQSALLTLSMLGKLHSFLSLADFLKFTFSIQQQKNDYGIPSVSNNLDPDQA